MFSSNLRMLVPLRRQAHGNKSTRSRQFGPCRNAKSIQIIIWSRVRQCARPVMLANTPRSVMRSLAVTARASTVELVSARAPDPHCVLHQDEFNILWNALQEGWNVRVGTRVPRRPPIPHPRPHLSSSQTNSSLRSVKLHRKLLRSEAKNAAVFPTSASDTEI